MLARRIAAAEVYEMAGESAVYDHPTHDRGGHPLAATGWEPSGFDPGAPMPEHVGGSAPPELAAQFVAASLVTAALFWLVLGGFGGWLYGRLSRPA